MKALVLEDVGQLVYKEVPDPRLRPGEVLIRIKACGICSSDIPRIFTTGTYHFPTIPGHEFSGEIIDCAADVDRSLLGKRAAIFPLLPCRKCSACKKEEYARCSDYNYFGSRCDGAFTEYISVPVWNLVLYPDRVSFAAAAMCEPMSVAKHAVDVGKISLGDTVAVIGTGTIGFLVALWSKAQGAKKVISIGIMDEYLDFAKELGIDYTMNSTKEDALQEYSEITNGNGADVVMECVGRMDAINNAILYAKKGGRVVLTGNPYGDITFPKNTYWKILRNELTVRGTWNSSYNSMVNNWKESIEAIESGKLDPSLLITQKFSLEQYKQAFSTIRDPNTLSIKVMFKI